jgi:hypothetical protein
VRAALAKELASRTKGLSLPLFTELPRSGLLGNPYAGYWIFAR